MKTMVQRLLAVLIFVLVFSSVSAAGDYSPLQGTAQLQIDPCVMKGVDNAEITVYSLDSAGNRLTKPLPDLFTDSTHTMGRRNPFNAAPSEPFLKYPPGFWGFWIANGRYEITITGTIKEGSVSYSLFMQAPASSGATSGFVNVKDWPYSAVGDGITDDTMAIKRAVSDVGMVGGGVVYFPNGTYKVGTNKETEGEQQLPIVLPTGVTMQGTSGAYFSSCKIYLPGDAATDNKTVIRMNECTRQAAIRDIEIQSANLKGTTGILATGDPPNTSERLSLSHLTVRGFNIGVDIQSLPGPGKDFDWQLASSEIDFANIVENKTAIHVDALNAELQISNSILSAGSGKDSTALLIDGASIIQIHDTFGRGANSENFIWMRTRHVHIDATSIECEGFINTLKNDVTGPLSDQYLYPIRISNSVLGAKILLRENCIYVSSGNTYYATSVETVNDGKTMLPHRPDGTAYPAYGGDPTPERPECDPLPMGGHADKVLIYSTGDHFFPAIGGPGCVGNDLIYLDEGAFGDFLLTGNSRLAFRAGQESADFHGPVNIGVPGFNYNLKRNNTNGFMDIFGTQSAPYRGFNFNGPIQLHSATWSEISAWQTIGPGGIIYCSDCKVGTNGTCEYSSSTPRGEIARYVGSSGWKCN